MDLNLVRARNIMRNNRYAQGLGVQRLAQLFQSSIAKKKSVANKSKALLPPNDMGNTGDWVKAGTGRTNKRVLAPENPEETMRCTRQRAARQQVCTTSLTEATEVGLDPDLSTNQNYGHSDNSGQDNITARTEVQTAMGLNSTKQGNLLLSAEEVDPMGLTTTEQDTLACSRQVGPRGKTMGREIDSISRGLGTMIPIIVKEGKRRPEAPMQAAKLASESGIIIRQHIPIFPNWKAYKNDVKQLDNLKKKLDGTFAIDINSAPVTAVCEDLLKGGTRQMRYRLKKKYFDGVPANQVRTTSPVGCMKDQEWRELVKMWSSPEHMEKCAKNQQNREKVRFQQRTGSRSYIAHAYVVKQEKYDTDLTAIDLFKSTHCSKTKGYSESVKKAIDDMHAQKALTSPSIEDGQQAETSIEVVSKVLPKSNTFLRNVGIKQAAAKSTNGTRELQAELDADKRQSAGLRQELELLKEQRQESDVKIDKQAEEIVSLKKMAADTQSLLRQMIAFGQGQISPPS